MIAPAPVNRASGFRDPPTGLLPALVVLVGMLLVALAVIAAEGGDPLALARLGTRYLNGDPSGTQGYDGQFVYYIALDPRPEQVAPRLDVPAYRYQRILLPISARMLSVGNVSALPWVLGLIGILSQAAGTWIVAELLAGWGVSRWYALVYGLFAGFTLAVRLDLPEPLAYALVAGAILAGERHKGLLSSFLYGLSLFAKEVTIVFVLAAALDHLAHRRWRDLGILVLVGVLPFLLFQGWLWGIFGQFGLSSGGDMATPFEIIPFMGLWRIGAYSLIYLAAMLVVFGPAAVLPAVWGAWASLKKILSGDINVVVLALLTNATLVATLPFSTFRETGGVLRILCGLVLAVLLFAARYQQHQVLRLSWLWLVLNVFLIKTSEV
jgi:hypothetical protein